MEVAVKTLFLGLNPEVIPQKQRYLQHKVQFSHRIGLCACLPITSREYFRSSHKVPCAVRAVSQDGVNVSSKVQDFIVAADIGEKELKVRVDVSGEKTQAIFDNVFSKLVAEAQPIPGFRRVKGGQTPNIPKDVLMHILGPSKVNKQAIKKIINTAVAEYVEKEGLKFTKDLRVEQSFEELEAIFQPGRDFSFDATIQLQESKKAKS